MSKQSDNPEVAQMRIRNHFVPPLAGGSWPRLTELMHPMLQIADGGGRITASPE